MSNYVVPTKCAVYRRHRGHHAQNCVVDVDHFGVGSLMLLAGISIHTRTQIVTIKSNLAARKYRTDVQLPHLVLHEPRYGVGKGQFTWSRSNDLKSPDRNPIAHV